MAADAERRAAEELARLSRRGLDLVAFWRAATEVVAAAVPHYEAPCWYTFDPASLLVTSHFHEGLPRIPREWLITEYQEDDVYKLADVARSPRGITTLHQATGGDPSRSRRWHHNVAYGGDQELVVGLRTRDGGIWGALTLYRERGEPLFDDRQQAFLRAVSGHLAEGARSALLLREAQEQREPDAPGLVVLTEDGRVESMTATADRWLDELPDGDRGAGRLPSSVLAVAGRALQGGGSGAAPPAVSRVLSRSGHWVVLHGQVLCSDGGRRAAVIVEAAHPARIASLLMAAYGLTERERDVTRLVLRGHSTEEIAAELVLSAHTVQQHLKSIFEKTGVHSRRDLVGRVFSSYYEPRVRDNEDRAARDQPLRGGPLPSGSTVRS